MKINVKSHESELKKLFSEIFSESSFFTDLIFSEKLCFSHCFAIKENNEIVSFLYGIEKDVRIEGDIKKCIYIYGVGTADKHRGKGYMRKLMEEIYTYFEDKNIEFLYLVPATEELFKMYEKMGYKTEFYLDKKTVELSNSDDIEITDGNYYKDYKEFSKDFRNIILMSEDDIKATLKYTTYSKIKNSGFLWESDRNTAYIRECILTDEDDLDTFLKYLGKKFEKAVITTIGKKPYAMLKPYRDFSFNIPCYTNMNFD